jgi:hypothetical protein
MSLTKPKLPTLADIERRRHELLTLAGLHSQRKTSPASPTPASQPTAAPPTPEPLLASALLRPFAEVQPDEAGGLAVNPAPLPPEPQPEPHPPLRACPERSRMGQQPAPAPKLSLQDVFDRYALYGLAGQAVRSLAPHTEAQPEAILLQLLAAFGNVIGPGPHCMVGATRHTLNLFVVLVGESSKARKGTSWNQISQLFAEVDRNWTENRVTSARLTARGLVGIFGQPGDRRLLLLAEELASVLHTMGRSRSQLSPLLRCAWDNATLRMLDRDRLLQASGGHLSLIGHITQRELADSLHRTEAHNGFANRCLWACVRRSRCLPDGGNLGAEELSAIAREFRRAVEWAQGHSEILFRRDEAASKLWNSYYATLSQDRPGLHSTATGRAEAQVLRLSALYAALDCSPIIQLPHLQGALALWDYCSASAASLFGTCVGDSIADRIHEALQASPDGLSREHIRNLFRGNVSSGSINQAFERLSSLGLVTSRYVIGRGRPTTLWSTVDYQYEELMEEETAEPKESPEET